MNNLLMTVLAKPIEQREFAQALHLSEARVSQLVSEGVLLRDGTFGEWLIAYSERLREQASGRGQELTIERAALARSQRIGQDLKNAVAQREFAPIGLLADVLAAASSAVVDRFDALSGDLARLCPHLDDASRSQVISVIASARNEWVRATATLSTQILDELAEPEPEDLPADDAVDDTEEVTP